MVNQEPNSRTTAHDRQPLLSDNSRQTTAGSPNNDQEEEVLTFDNGQFGPHITPNLMVAILTYFIFVTGQTFIATANIDVLLALICKDEYQQDYVSGTAGLQILGLPHEDPRCRQSTVAARVASFSSYDAVITGILGVLVVPKLASWSDKIGRKPILMWGALSAALNDLIRLLCILYPDVVNYRWLLLAYFVRGTGGTWAAMQMLNGTYIADCTTPHSRSQYLGILEAFFFGALAAGPLLGSLFLSLFPQSFTELFSITLVIDLVYFALLFFVIGESRSKEKQFESRINDYEDSNNGYGTSIWNIFKPLKKLSFNHIQNNPVKKRNARTMVALMALIADIGQATAPIFMIFAEFRFKWTSIENGYLMTAFGVSRSLILGLVYPVLVKYFNSRWHVSHDNVDRVDLLLLRVGLLVGGLGFMAVSFAPNGRVFMGAIIGDSLAAVLVPTLKNGIIKFIEPANIGQVMGSISFLTSITLIVATQVFYRIFELTVAFHPQFVFEMGSMCFLMLIGLTYTMSPSLTDYEEDVGDNETAV